MSLLCIAVWIFTFQYEDVYNETLARGAISLAAIPQSLSLLQFLCMVPSLGHFVIMIGAVLADVVNFLFVFIACIIGFSIALRGIFYDNENFVSTGQTLLTVYSGIFGNLDFSIFDLDHPFDHLGQGLLVVYSMLTAIVLINLLIARMAYTYQTVSERVEEEWGFYKAETTQTFLEFEDRNPLCKLPAPLNTVSMLAALFGLLLRPLRNCSKNGETNEDRLWKILTKLVADAFFR